MSGDAGALCVPGRGGETLRDMVNPPRCCSSRCRPVFGPASVNKLQQPGGAVRGAETEDLSVVLKPKISPPPPVRCSSAASLADWLT